MDCSEFQAIVAGEREEDLSSAESDAFEGHLESCGSCREAVGRAEEDLERLSQLAEPPLVAASAWTKIDEAVRLQARKRPGREDPFAPEQDAAPVKLLEPAMPVTRARVTALPGRGRIVLAFVACAAAVVMAFGFFALPAPAPTHSEIGRVKPPEPDDAVVDFEKTKVGKDLKKLVDQGRLIVVQGN